MAVDSLGENGIKPSDIKKKQHLGEVLRAREQISGEALEQVLEYQAKDKTAVRLGELLLHRGLVSKDDLVSALEEVTRLQYEDARSATVEKPALNLIPRAVASRHKVFPLACEGKRIVAIMAEPQNLRLLDELRFRTGMEVSPRLGFKSEIEEAIRKYYGDTESAESKAAESGGLVSIASGSTDTQPTATGKRVLLKWTLVVGGILGVFFIWWLGSAFSDAARLSDAAVAEFHRQMNAGEFEFIYAHADEAFQHAGKKEETLRFLGGVHRKLGNAGNTTRSGITVETGTSGTFVAVSYRTAYERGVADETFVWRKTSAGNLSLVGYTLETNAIFTE